jgi:hypothetical protein
MASAYFVADNGRWIGRVVLDGQRREVVATTKTEARSAPTRCRLRVEWLVAPW